MSSMKALTGYNFELFFFKASIPTLCRLQLYLGYNPQHVLEMKVGTIILCFQP